MALFGKKKGADEAPATTSTSTTDNGAFDFDAIARDLETSGGSSPLDSLLSQPVGAQTTGAPVQTEESAFDFPGPDAPLVTTPSASSFEPRAQVTTVVTATPPASQMTPASIQAPLPPVVDTEQRTALPAPDVYGNPNGKAKKSLPIIPLLGALGALAIVGGGAMFFLKSQSASVDTDTPAPSPRPRVAKAPVAPTRPTTAVRPGTPPVSPAGAPPRVAGTALRPSSPGIAPPPVAPGARPKLPVIAATSAAQTGTNTAKGPLATTGLDAGLAARLKALWQAGADAKHRKNFKEARDAWQEALTLSPGHPGFAESIAKLPK